MEVTRKATPWRHLFRFRLRSLFLLTTVCCLVVCFGPPVWRWAFPPAPQLPNAIWGPTDDIQYFKPGPEFKLHSEAAAIKSAREQDNESR